MTDMDLGVGVDMGSAPVVPGGVNPNLLLWTEEFDDAAWTKSGVVIEADETADPNAGLTADLATYDVESFLSQTTTTAATTGAAVAANRTATTEWQRFSAAGTFDSLTYTLSVHLKASSGTQQITLRLFRSGGFLVTSFANLDDVEGRIVYVWGAKLEQGSLTDYIHRTT